MGSLWFLLGKASTIECIYISVVTIIATLQNLVSFFKNLVGLKIKSSGGTKAREGEGEYVNTHFLK